MNGGEEGSESSESYGRGKAQSKSSARSSSIGWTAGRNAGSEEKTRGAPREEQGVVSSDEREEAEVVKVKLGFFGAKDTEISDQPVLSRSRELDIDSHIRVLRRSLGILHALRPESVSSSLENQLMTELLRGISCGSVS